jgi:hypothetical protein
VVVDPPVVSDPDDEDDVDEVVDVAWRVVVVPVDVSSSSPQAAATSSRIAAMTREDVRARALTAALYPAGAPITRGLCAT